MSAAVRTSRDGRRRPRSPPPCGVRPVRSRRDSWAEGGCGVAGRAPGGSRRSAGIMFTPGRVDAQHQHVAGRRRGSRRCPQRRCAGRSRRISIAASVAICIKLPGTQMLAGGTDERLTGGSQRPGSHLVHHVALQREGIPPLRQGQVAPSAGCRVGYARRAVGDPGSPPPAPTVLATRTPVARSRPAAVSHRRRQPPARAGDSAPGAGRPTGPASNCRCSSRPAVVTYSSSACWVHAIHLHTTHMGDHLFRVGAGKRRKRLVQMRAAGNVPSGLPRCWFRL